LVSLPDFLGVKVTTLVVQLFSAQQLPAAPWRQKDIAVRQALWDILSYKLYAVAGVQGGPQESITHISCLEKL